MVEDGGEKIGSLCSSDVKINWKIASKIRNVINNLWVAISFLLLFLSGRYRNQAKYLLKLKIVLSLL